LSWSADVDIVSILCECGVWVDVCSFVTAVTVR